jgi:hypothetical protein
MAEWSNATDLRSVLFGGAGSNPAGVIILMIHTAKTNFILTFTQNDVVQFHGSEMTAWCWIN